MAVVKIFVPNTRDSIITNVIIIPSLVNDYKLLFIQIFAIIVFVYAW